MLALHSIPTNNAVMNILNHVPLQTSAYISLGYILKERISRSYIHIILSPFELL